MGIGLGGALALVLVVLDVWVLAVTLRSRARAGLKILWTVLILGLPLLGLVLWLLLGPRRAER